MTKHNPKGWIGRRPRDQKTSSERVSMIKCRKISYCPLATAEVM